MTRNMMLLGFAILFAPVLVGAVEITPADSPIKLDLYGVLIANTYWNSSGVFGSDVPLWTVAATDPRAGDKELGMIARQSRFGFKVKGPDVGTAKLSGVFEMDLFGSMPNGGQKASFAQVRVRLANMKLDWGNASFSAGQDWTILAPLNPTSLAHFAVVGLATSGNIWLRYPQVRFEAFAKRGESKFGVTAGMVRPVAGSDPTEPGSFVDVSGAGERSSMPFLQGRAFYTKTLSEKTIAVGVSMHYGKESYKFGTTTITRKKVDTWAVAADFQIPLGKAVGIQGEIFTGTNLDSFQGGINQGVSVNESAADVVTIDATGGWVQLSVTPPQKKELTFHLTYGTDRPDNELLKAGQRSENSTLMAGLFYKPAASFQTAVEYALINTRYRLGKKNDASVLNVAFAFTF
ncbi:MAG: hypothetical protein HYX75_18200 [Acidobacteria bacterium]|nr:hypothetical protein [Acidobacteriota bacterium]